MKYFSGSVFKSSYRDISSFFQQGQISNHVRKRKHIDFNSSNIFFKSMASNFCTQSQRENETQQQRSVLVVGLGNHDMPNTRHSVGMQVVSRMASELRLHWKNERKTCGGNIAVYTCLNQQQCVLLKPRVAMNLNGKSVKKTASHFGILPEDVYLVHDELDKSVGKYRFKYGGSARGHNGVRSVQQCLKSEAMPRLLVGIDRPVIQSKVVEHVLSNFTTHEMDEIDKTIKQCINALEIEFQKKYGIRMIQENKENQDN